MVEQEIKRLILDQNEENTKTIKLLLGDTQRCPDSLVYRNSPKKRASDLSWLDEEWLDTVFDQQEDDEYEQPDINLF